MSEANALAIKDGRIAWIGGIFYNFYISVHYGHENTILRAEVFYEALFSRWKRD